MNIYVLCPETVSPVGAVRGYYRYVDILNKNGFSAYILHKDKGFRCTWFNNNTRIAYIKNNRTKRLLGKMGIIPNTSSGLEEIHLVGSHSEKIDENDYLVVPAVYGPAIRKMAKGTKKIIFNRGCYYATFREYSSIVGNVINTPYIDKEIVAVIVVSEDNKKYLNYVFPDIKVFRHRNSVDTNLFSYESNKKKQICFIGTKNRKDVIQVISILKIRGVLSEYEIVPIVNKSEEEVARIMKESLIHLSFGYAEGFQRPPAEAMACGCVVVGYHGRGGKEFFKPEFSYPIEAGDIIGFAKAAEKVIDIHKKAPKRLVQKTERASAFIRENYSPEREERDVLTFWSNIINNSNL